MREGRNVASGARISRRAMRGWRGALTGRLLAALSVAALSVWYFAVHRQPSTDRYHGMVTALGWTALGLCLVVTALSVRKRIPSGDNE